MTMNLKTKKEIQELFNQVLQPKSHEERVALETRLLMARFLSGIQLAMDKRGIKKKDLASLIGTSASYITQIFTGTKIANLETITRMMLALDLQFEIKAKSGKPDTGSSPHPGSSGNDDIIMVAEE